MVSVLFLCTGNSCRSQMAEGWFRELVLRVLVLEELVLEELGLRKPGFNHHVASAGIESHGLNPMAVQVMQESAVDISQQTSKQIDEFELEDFDVLVTVCGDADVRCPALPARIKKHHWPLSDPARLRGSEYRIIEGFRNSREEIRQKVFELILEIS